MGIVQIKAIPFIYGGFMKRVYVPLTEESVLVPANWNYTLRDGIIYCWEKAVEAHAYNGQAVEVFAFFEDGEARLSYRYTKRFFNLKQPKKCLNENIICMGDEVI